MATKLLPLKTSDDKFNNNDKNTADLSPQAGELEKEVNAKDWYTQQLSKRFNDLGQQRRNHYCEYVWSSGGQQILHENLSAYLKPQCLFETRYLLVLHIDLDISVSAINTKFP